MRFLKAFFSSSERVSALAMTGMMFTRSWSLFKKSMSIAFRLFTRTRNKDEQVNTLPDLQKKKEKKRNILVAGGRHKVKAAVNAVIDNVLAVHATLLVKVGIIPFLNTLQDGLPAGVFFHQISFSSSKSYPLIEC